MIFTKYSNTFRWVMIAISFVIVSLILWNTYTFFQNFKDEERTKMKIWSYEHEQVLNQDLDSTDLDST